MKNIKDEFLQLSEKRIGSVLITVHKYCREEEASCIKWLESTEEGHNNNQWLGVESSKIQVTNKVHILPERERNRWSYEGCAGFEDPLRVFQPRCKAAYNERWSTVSSLLFVNLSVRSHAEFSSGICTKFWLDDIKMCHGKHSFDELPLKTCRIMLKVRMTWGNLSFQCLQSMAVWPGQNAMGQESEGF